jgi:hypothetical protein
MAGIVNQAWTVGDPTGDGGSDTQAKLIRRFRWRWILFSRVSLGIIGLLLTTNEITVISCKPNACEGTNLLVLGGV